jgi:hypothetical protein
MKYRIYVNGWIAASRTRRLVSEFLPSQEEISHPVISVAGDRKRAGPT